MMSGSDPKTPAPKKDHIYGSKTNPKGSASSGKSKAVTFSKKIEDSLKSKVENHNKKASGGRRATLGMLKAVYRRGAGAFSRSHRPGMTRDQWAMGRVNAFLHLLSAGKPKNPNYVTDNDLLPASHPRSSRKKSVTAAGMLVPEEQDLANAILEVVEKYGKFNEDETGVWAGYTPAEENDVKNIGVKCLNCVFYQGGTQCQIIALPVEADGKCRFAIIPDGVVSPEAIKEKELQPLIEDLYYEKELSVSLFDTASEYDSPEAALTALAEFSDYGYNLKDALRAAWLRAVRDGEDPYQRAKNLAQYAHDSNDADLLPAHEKGSSQV
jgi:hypothetical protein